MASCQWSQSVLTVAGDWNEWPGVEACLHLAGDRCELFVSEYEVAHDPSQVLLHGANRALPKSSEMRRFCWNVDPLNSAFEEGLMDDAIVVMIG